MRVIHKSECGRYRIVELPDSDVDLENLEGDTYRPECHPEIPAEQILREQRAFRNLVEREGVFGYALEWWNPAPDMGWEHVDSCWGFVGQYSETEETFKHYIVDELKSVIKEKVS